MKNIFIPFIILSALLTPALNYGSGDPFSQTKFVPAISFIMDVSWLNRNLEGFSADGFEIPGFLHAGNTEGHSHSGSILNGVKGFNLNYAELSLFATVDPYFDLFTSFHLSEESFEIEEAYVSTRKLPYGFRLKIGKFLSSFGRFNAQHAHTWNFQELPLVYHVFFGEEGLNEKGFQLNWVAPTDFYLTLGCEILQGENEMSFGIESEEKSGIEENLDLDIPDVNIPGMFTLFVKTSFDMGNHIFLGGVSYAAGDSISFYENGDGEYIESGRSKILGIDLTWKYLIDSYRYISLQTEYMHKLFIGGIYGQYKYGEMDPIDSRGFDFERSQSGFYSELVFRFSKLWRSAFRYDLLNQNRVEFGGDGYVFPEDLKRYSFMIDYTPTEFSRIRLQYNYNKYLYYNGDLKNFGELNLQLNIAVGAHGAHPF